MKLSHATNDAVLQELGRRLARARLARNLAQARLAEDAGLALRTVQNVEAGEGSSMETWIRLLRALGELDGLDTWLEDEGPGPIELADRRGRRRRRASPERSEDSDS